MGIRTKPRSLTLFGMTIPCHFDPFDFAQDRLREKSACVPSATRDLAFLPSFILPNGLFGFNILFNSISVSIEQSFYF